MADISKLLFFDKNGNPIPMKLNDDGIWEANLYFDKVSTGLFETQQIIIGEVPVDSNILTRPSCFTYSGNVCTNILVEWNKDIDDYYDKHEHEIGLYTIKRVYENGETFLDMNKLDEFDKFDGDTSCMCGDSDYRCDSDSDYVCCDSDSDYVCECGCKSNLCIVGKDSPITLNLYFHSDEQITARRDLLIGYEDGSEEVLVAVIRLYGESVEEDERLKHLIENFGYSIDADDVKIFDTSDVNETSPDYILLNEKRKEMMMEGSNIYPFIGSYKALVNAIKFYGYENISIREYWKNRENGRFLLTDDLDVNKVKTLRDTNRRIALPNNEWRKTGLLTLVYKRNGVMRGNDGNILFYEYETEGDRVTPTGYNGDGNFINDGLPKVEDYENYSIDEILIKLYALKRKLEKVYLPLNARFWDIRLESDVFTKHCLLHIPSQGRRDFINVGMPVECEFTKKLYIENQTALAEYNANAKSAGVQTPIGEMPLYDDVVNNEVFPKLRHDKNGDEIYADLVVRNTSFVGDFDKDYIDRFTKATFIVKKDATNETLANGMSVSSPAFVTSVTESKKGEDTHIKLPYIGTYTLIVMFLDGFGNPSEKTYKDAIRVEPKRLWFCGWYQTTDDETNKVVSPNDLLDLTWENIDKSRLLEVNTYKTTLEDYKDASGGKHINAKSITMPTSASDRNTYYNELNKDMSMMLYSQYDEAKDIFEVSYPGPFRISNISHLKPSDFKSMTVAMTRETGDVYGSFYVNPSPNKYLQIITKRNHIGLCACNLRALQLSQDPIIQKYVYEELNGQIHAVCKHASFNPMFIDVVDDTELPHKNGNVWEITIHNNDSHIEFKGEANNPSWQYPPIQLHAFQNNTFDHPLWVCFAYDTCGINMKCHPTWTIVNDTTDDIVIMKHNPNGGVGGHNVSDPYYDDSDDVFEADHEGAETFGYLFKEDGDYYITLSINDINGNTYTITQHMLRINGIPHYRRNRIVSLGNDGTLQQGNNGNSGIIVSPINGESTQQGNSGNSGILVESSSTSSGSNIQANNGNSGVVVTPSGTTTQGNGGTSGIVVSANEGSTAQNNNGNSGVMVN